jgi:hypothetical protein
VSHEQRQQQSPLARRGVRPQRALAAKAQQEKEHQGREERVERVGLGGQGLEPQGIGQAGEQAAERRCQQGPRGAIAESSLLLDLAAA